MKSAIAKGNVLSAVTKTPVATKAILVPQRSTINVYGNTGRAFLLSPIPSASARAALDSRYILLLNGHIESGSHMTEGDRKAIADLAKMVADLSTSIGNTQIDFSNLFEIVNQGQPNEYILAKLSFHSKNDVVAFSNGADGGTVPSIPIATYTTAGVVKVDPTTMTVDSAGVIAVKGDLFNLSNYWTKTDSDERYLLKTEKLDLTGYATKIYVDDQISTHTHTLYVKYQTPETPAPQTIYGDIRVIGKIYSSDDIVAFSDGTGGGTAPSIPLATYATVGVVKVDPSTMTVDAAGMIAVKGDLFNLSNYYDKSASDERFSAIGHRHLFSDIDGKPTTLGGYGITDAMTASQINTAIAQAKADIVNSSPAALDTLYEFAAALGNDPNFATTTATALGNRLRVDIATQGLTDAQRANGRANLGLGSAALLSGDHVFKAKLGCLDLNNCTEEGTYFWIPNTPNRPATAYGTIITIDGIGGWFNQLALGTDKYTLAWRSSINNSTTWDEWKDIYHSGNINRGDTDFTAKSITVNEYLKFSNVKMKWGGNITPTNNFQITKAANAFHIEVADGDTGGIAIDNDAVTVYGAGDGGYVFRVVDEDVLQSAGFDGATIFEVLQDSGVAVRRGGLSVAGAITAGGEITTSANKLRGPDGNVKWTAQVSATGDYLEFYNASGVLEMRLSQAGKIQVRDDVEAFSNFS